MINISISEDLLKNVPTLQLSIISCEVKIKEGSNELWEEINKMASDIAVQLKVEDISKLPAIQASRKAYKACGKDPARYRLSAEALLRRVVKKVDLYRINNVVDLLNLVSFSSGFSIGGYDMDKLNGEVVFGIGKKNEDYKGVGKGDLNIEFLPVFRDKEGAFGSPTSDSERTRLTEETKHFLMILIGFGGNGILHETTDFAIELLRKYGNAENIQNQLI